MRNSPFRKLKLPSEKGDVQRPPSGEGGEPIAEIVDKRGRDRKRRLAKLREKRTEKGRDFGVAYASGRDNGSNRRAVPKKWGGTAFSRPEQENQGISSPN